MDVKDRSILPDVFPGGLALQDPAPASPVDNSGQASFAETLQRAQTSATVETPQTVPSNQAPASPPDLSATNPEETLTAADAAPISLAPAFPADIQPQPLVELQRLEPKAARCDLSETEISDVSATAETLTAGLFAVTTPSEPIADRTQSAPVAPMSLGKALQSPAASAPASQPAPATPMPTIPSRLQAGLTPAGAKTHSTEAKPLQPVTAPEPTTISAVSQSVPAAPALDVPNGAAKRPEVTPSAAARTVESSDTDIAQTVPDHSTATVSDTPAPESKTARSAPESLSKENPPALWAKSVRRHASSRLEPDSEPAANPLPTVIPVAPVPAAVKSTPVFSPERRESTTDAVTARDPRSSSVSELPAGSRALLGVLTPGPRESGHIGQLPAPAPRDSVDKVPLMEQLHPALRQAVLQDRQLTIVLRPPELGMVQIDILRQDGQVSARLQTETEAAHRLLTEHLPQLHDSLTTWGVSADLVQIVRAEPPPEHFGNSQPFADGQPAGREDAQARQESPQHRPPQPQLAEEPERDDIPIPGVRSRSALNLRI